MKETIEYQNIHGNRNYKDSLFSMTFKRKEDLLSLYNAVNGTNYNNPEDLEINTLENALYITIKNDVSFIVGCTMNLYEHQSSYNPNMPLRGVVYFAQLFNKFVEMRKLNLYSSALQKIPTPQYIVFYNGKKSEPDRQILKLSDAFQTSGGCLECEAVMLNINYGQNRELMEKCKRLEEYAIFVATVRKNASDANRKLSDAITLAIDECIEKGILLDILVEQRAEVFMYILESFDKEIYERDLKAEAIAEGLAEGLAEGRAQGLEEGRAQGLEEGLEEGRAQGLAEGREQGLAEGREEGRLKEKRALIKKKLDKGRSLEEIADALEEEPEAIKKLIEEMQKN